MGVLKIDPLTNDDEVIKDTICKLMGLKFRAKAFSFPILMNAIEKMPFCSTLSYNKIYGRWEFSNYQEGEWLSDKQKFNKVGGLNFTFAEANPETAIARGIHYYYHTKVKNEKQ